MGFHSPPPPSHGPAVVRFEAARRCYGRWRTTWRRRSWSWTATGPAARRSLSGTMAGVCVWSWVVDVEWILGWRWFNIFNIDNLRSFGEFCWGRMDFHGWFKEFNGFGWVVNGVERILNQCESISERPWSILMSPCDIFATLYHKPETWAKLMQCPN